MTELIYGVHSVESLLRYDSSCFLCSYILNTHLNKRLKLLSYQLKQLNIPVHYCDRRYLSKKVRTVMHQGVVAKVRRKNVFTEKDICSLLEKFRKTCLLLILDNIVDPRNLGACLRCAGAFGVDMVIVSRYRSVGLNSVVWKVASGVADNIPFVRITNLFRILQLLKACNIWIIGTVLQQESSIFRADLSGDRLALVVGSEESGIRFLTRKHCDELVSIPMVNSFASLNVSVATGIFLFEVLRNRLCIKSS